ncbi:MAG: site-specific DNA-methyltransferase [Chloroflexi bacterium]|nr:site-specific DNA-methyltransferase [Chloroflexota bacterium]TDI84313.1 MAG: site-specific DNA-methyltransferase [Chloroflexota bacterium]
MGKSGSKRTTTSSFGSRGRISHDASHFYSSRLYRGLGPDGVSEYIERELPAEYRDRIFGSSSQEMSELPDHSVHLMVTSPPYNVRKEYDEDLSLEEYRELLRTVFKETYRVLVTGGRACVNVANLGRKPYLPLHAFVIEDMINAGFHMRGEIIWDKGASAAASTAWGSWLSASNPVLRDVHEYILVFSKDTFSRKGIGKDSTIERDEFLEWTKSIWRIPAVSARKIGHPAPFPEELPERLIKLYTYRGDVVLDPFAGSGTSCVAALKNGRTYVGYEIEEEYVGLAEARLTAARDSSEH